MPRARFPKGRPRTHVALDDVIEQGVIFSNMLAQARRQVRRVLATSGRRDAAPIDLEVIAMIADMKRSLSGRNMRVVVEALVAELVEMDEREDRPDASRL